MDPLPPDPYLALGLSKDVDSAVIKSTYRKLVLKCHPDKVTDESLKKQKQEEFHKIQQAYELIGEEDSRARYDAEVKLEALRKEKAARGASASGPEVRTARYDVRTQAPAGATFKATGPSRYEEHKPSRYADDRYYEERSRSKYDTYEAYPSKQSSSRSSREKVSPQKPSRESSDRTRSDYKKSRDKERDRDRRHVASERERDSDPSGDEKARYEADYKRRSEEARRRAEEDEARKAAADLRRKAEDRRYEDKYDRRQKLSDQSNDAVHYIRMSSKADPERPSPSRTTSSRDVRDYYESRDSRSRRDPPVRRSSARPRDRHSPAGRERKGPEIVDWEEDRKVPAFKHSSSSPAEIHVPRTTPLRSYTDSRDHRRTETSPTPMFRRAETMPTVPQTSSSSRKASTVPRSSGLRESATPHDSGSSSPEAYQTIPSASSTKRYYYPTPGGGVSLAPEDVGVANGHRTVLREPERRHRSPSPLTRPPMGANRPSESSSVRYTTAAPSKSSVPPPPLGRSATTNVADDRGRSRPLYGEITSESLRRENARRQTSFSPDQVSYGKKYGPEDVNWAPRGGSGRDRLERDAKPMLSRHATYAY